MLADRAAQRTFGEDSLALEAACAEGVGLCTLVGIDGSFSRRPGAQLAVLPDGSFRGSLSSQCLEAQLAADLASCDGPRIVRYGKGSPNIDFRLPCGGGLDILLEPRPDRVACRRTMEALGDRRPAQLVFGDGNRHFTRRYLPHLRIVALGEGPELASVTRLCAALNIEVQALGKDDLALGCTPDGLRYDAWTACLLLFHDHEWEPALLRQALASDTFYIGAQGGERARAERVLNLMAWGIREEDIARVTSPVGSIPNCKTPEALALSAVTEIVMHYERLHAAS